MHPTKPDDHLLLAVGFACINALMLALMSLFAKLLSAHFGPIEVTFFRNIFSLAALFLWLLCTRNLFVLKTQRPWAHVFRGAIGTAGIVLGMWSLSLLPLAEATILLFTSPLFTLVLSAILLKENIGPYRIGAVIFGFMGVVVMANPFSDHLHLPVLGLIAGLGWGFFAGSVDTCLRWIGQTESSTRTVFYFMLFGTVVTGLYWPMSAANMSGLSLHAILIVCGLGTAGLLSLLSKTQSFRLGQASIISPVMYTMIIWSMLFDYLFWDKTPGLNVLCGAAIIIGANLFILYREHKKAVLISDNP